MGVSCIARKKFLDRVMEFGELEKLADMLRRWYLIRAGVHGASGLVIAEARVYAFPRPEGESIRAGLAGRASECTCDATDPDVIRLTGPTTPAGGPCDLAPWRAALNGSPVGGCVQLRLTISGPVPSPHGAPGDAVGSFVMNGSPTESGALLLKALWQVGADTTMERVYDHVVWDKEAALLDCFEMFQGQCTIGPVESAASLAMHRFGKAAQHLFASRQEERMVMRLTRHWAELPDDRGPAAFARRFMVPLAAGAGLATVSFTFRESRSLLVVCAIPAAYLLLSAVWVAWKKLLFVGKYHTRMRRGLGILYSGPIRAVPTTPAAEPTATERKTAGELEALGARHVCDLAVSSVKGPMSDQHIYALGDATVATAVLKTTENLIFFPPKPIMVASTRFADGRRHVTVGSPVYRKPSRRHVTGRCLPNGGTAEELMALHRRHVDRLIAGGAVPVEPPCTGEGVVEQTCAEHEESCEAWKQHPYSWGDALHDAFKVCRREYLAD